eukprot:XP_017456270.1 PREDICTED: basic proline-rich protein-like [Rattus norvegicus]
MKRSGLGAGSPVDSDSSSNQNLAGLGPNKGKALSEPPASPAFPDWVPRKEAPRGPRLRPGRRGHERDQLTLTLGIQPPLQLCAELAEPSLCGRAGCRARGRGGAGTQGVDPRVTATRVPTPKRVHRPFQTLSGLTPTSSGSLSPTVPIPIKWGRSLEVQRPPEPFLRERREATGPRQRPISGSRTLFSKVYLSTKGAAAAGAAQAGDTSAALGDHVRREGAGGRSGERGTKTWGGGGAAGAGRRLERLSAAGGAGRGLRGRRPAEAGAARRGRGAGRLPTLSAPPPRPPLPARPDPHQSPGHGRSAPRPSYVAPERAGAGARRSERRRKKTMQSIKSFSPKMNAEPSGHPWSEPAAAAVNGHRRGQAAATAPTPRLRSCAPPGLLLARCGSSSRAASSALAAASAAAPPRASPPPAQPPPPAALGEARRGPEPYYSAGLGGVANAARGSLANLPLSRPGSLPLILRLLFQTRVGEADRRGAECACGGEAGRGGRMGGGGEGGKKCTAEGRVETDTGSKMARSPPAPPPPRPPPGHVLPSFLKGGLGISVGVVGPVAAPSPARRAPSSRARGGGDGGISPQRHTPLSRRGPLGPARRPAPHHVSRSRRTRPRGPPPGAPGRCPGSAPPNLRRIRPAETTAAAPPAGGRGEARAGSSRAGSARGVGRAGRR